MLQAACLAVPLGGCWINGTPPEPGLDIPAAYTGGPKKPSVADAATPSLDWWRGFRSRELTDIVDNANAANLDIAAAVARIVQADAQSRIAGAALLPTVDLNGNGTVHMSAQTSGSMEGLLFAQDPAETADSVTHSINGNGNVTYEGTFYFGKQDVDINGNGNANATAPFTMFIADKMTFNGNGTFNLNSNFQNSNVPPPKGMNLNRVTLLK